MRTLPSVLALLVSCSGLVTSYPTDEENLEKTYVSSSHNTLSSANGYQVSLREESLDGECRTQLFIKGNGLYKVIAYPCKIRPHSVINLNKTLLVGDEWYSDEYGVLVHLIDGKCVKELFQGKPGAYTSSAMLMPDADCERVKLKIVILKEQQARWEEWYKQKQQEAQSQLMQIQTNLQSLQQNLLGGLFSGLPWGLLGKK